MSAEVEGWKSERRKGRRGEAGVKLGGVAGRALGVVVAVAAVFVIAVVLGLVVVQRRVGWGRCGEE